ncbi:DUF4388 domain-containing protein [Candidatus Gracilibacteria bacterium]|nr:DUF4388 domain-containing protein [Candidatus Gracilibacteria bacterium]
MSLHGDLEDLPLLDMLRLFQRNQQSGSLQIVTATEQALIDFVDGQAAHAVIAERSVGRVSSQGDGALITLLHWSTGSFTLQAASGPPFVRTIIRSTSELIGEALRERSNAPLDRVIESISLHTPLRMLPEVAGQGEGISVSREEWHILTLISEQLTPAQLGQRTGYDQAQVVCCVARLIQLGLVALAPLAHMPERPLRVAAPDAGLGQAAPALPTQQVALAIRKRLDPYNAPMAIPAFCTL